VAIKVGINGYGRIGRLCLRALHERPELGLEVVHINEIAGDAACMAHLTEFDSVHGRFNHHLDAEDQAILLDGQRINFSRHEQISSIDWAGSGVEVVIEATGAFRKAEQLQQHLKQGAQQVIVAAPVADPEVPNIVMGINQHSYRPKVHRLVSAASCTTNCLAPVVKVLHDQFGIRSGTMTTMHDLTNTQVVVDKGDKDWRRARAASMSLSPTTTGSAKAIGRIFPELAGRIDGLAVRVPMLNASLTDFVCVLETSVDVETVNQALADAAAGPLAGVLGYETRPLVSIDYVNDPRSSIVDALSTRVIDQNLIKVLAWYDNEWGYAQRLIELLAYMRKQ